MITAAPSLSAPEKHSHAAIKVPRQARNRFRKRFIPFDFPCNYPKVAFGKDKTNPHTFENLRKTARPLANQAVGRPLFNRAWPTRRISIGTYHNPCPSSLISHGMRTYKDTVGFGPYLLGLVPMLITRTWLSFSAWCPSRRSPVHFWQQHTWTRALGQASRSISVATL